MCSGIIGELTSRRSANNPLGFDRVHPLITDQNFPTEAWPILDDAELTCYGSGSWVTAQFVHRDFAKRRRRAANVVETLLYAAMRGTCWYYLPALGQTLTTGGVEYVVVLNIIDRPSVPREAQLVPVLGKWKHVHSFLSLPAGDK